MPDHTFDTIQALLEQIEKFTRMLRDFIMIEYHTSKKETKRQRNTTSNPDPPAAR